MTGPNDETLPMVAGGLGLVSVVIVLGLEVILLLFWPTANALPSKLHKKAERPSETTSSRLITNNLPSKLHKKVEHSSEPNYGRLMPMLYPLSYMRRTSV